MNEKSIVLVIKALKMTDKVLAIALQKAIDVLKKEKEKALTPKDMNGRGKQSVKQLTKQGAGVSNIEISDKNIKSFEGVARKYGVDFALRKDISEQPAKYLVFFKARDADALTAAFQEFSAKQLNQQKQKKPSILGAMRGLLGKVKNQAISTTKNKTKGLEL